MFDLFIALHFFNNCSMTCDQSWKPAAQRDRMDFRNGKEEGETPRKRLAGNSDRIGEKSFHLKNSFTPRVSLQSRNVLKRPQARKLGEVTP